MKKASKILCLIGGILGIVLALLWLVLSIVEFVYGGIFAALDAGTVSWGDLPAEVREYLANFMNNQGFSSFAAAAAFLIGQGVLYLIMFFFSVASSVVSFIVSKKEKTGLPLPIVCVVLSWAGNVCSFVGGALAIVNWAVVERKE